LHVLSRIIKSQINEQGNFALLKAETICLFYSGVMVANSDAYLLPDYSGIETDNNKATLILRRTA
jgi:hypothetical protein